MKFVYRCEIIRLKMVNILAHSAEGSKDHAAEICTPVVFGDGSGVSHGGGSAAAGPLTALSCLAPSAADGGFLAIGVHREIERFRHARDEPNRGSGS